MDAENSSARIEYHKLIRDFIPAIIRGQGQVCEVVTMTEEEYHQALREKLLEEAQEAAEASSDTLVTELADLYEVISALSQMHHLSNEAILVEQERRRLQRGGFEQRLRLLWVR